jgi:anti-sigma B factor antagonist
MAQFEAETTGGDDRLVVVLAGECDLSVRDALTEALTDAVDRAPVVVVDLAAVTFLDSSGVHALVTAHRAARAQDRRVYVAGAVGVVADVLELTGVGELLSPPGSVDGGPSS